MKEQGEKIAMLTVYDYSSAKILDEGGIDVLLVGDSASNVMAGHETTLPITLDQMIYNAQSVVRAVKRALIVVDLPFGSYRCNSMKALDSAIRIMKESGAHAVKLEGGEEIAEYGCDGGTEAAEVEGEGGQEATRGDPTEARCGYEEEDRRQEIARRVGGRGASQTRRGTRQEGARCKGKGESRIPQEVEGEAEKRFRR